MQTFLPYPDFIKTAKCLDYRRLGKQRVEVKQILNALKNGGGWSNHPAVKMWRGFEPALAKYGNVMILEWKNRGYNNTMEYFHCHEDCPLPPWFGDEKIHSSHRANLIRKDPEFYCKFGWEEDPIEGYVWPVK
jgi:hypothetical protein